MKIAHLSDIHFFKKQLNLGTLFSKSLLGTLNYCLNRQGSSVTFDLFELPRFLKDKGVTHVIISGDFTTTSNIKEYLAAASFIDQLESQKLKVFNIPGNHDNYTRKAEKSKRFYQYIKSAKGLKEEGIACEDFGGGYKCITLDTTLATPYWSSQGSFSKKLEQNLLNLLSSIPKDQPLIMVNHFPVIRGNRPFRHQMKRCEALREIIEANPNIILYLHGHTHKSEFTNSNPLMINSGSLTLSKGGSFHIMDLSSDFLEVEAYTHYENQWQVRMKKSFPFPKRPQKN